MKSYSHLFVSDLDGTLLTSKASLSNGSVKLLNEAIAGGAGFTVATARTPATVDVIMHGVNMQLPAIVFTGAAWWHFDTRTYSHTRFLQPDTVSKLIDLFQQFAVTPFIYTLHSRKTGDLIDVFYNALRPTLCDAEFIRLRSDLELKKFHIGIAAPPDNYDKTILFFASGTPQIIAKIADSVLHTTDCSCSFYDDIYNPGISLIEVFAPNVSKAIAIDELRHSIEARHLTVFGDNLNDLSMFAVADTSVAVSNAHERTLQQADIIIASNNDDSVARYIFQSTV